MNREPDYSEAFYREHANRYAEVSRLALQSIYASSYHPNLTGDHDLVARLQEMAPGKRGLDAGCGAEGRDVYNLLIEALIEASEDELGGAMHFVDSKGAPHVVMFLKKG